MEVLDQVINDFKDNTSIENRVTFSVINVMDLIFLVLGPITVPRSYRSTKQVCSVHFPIKFWSILSVW